MWVIYLYFCSHYLVTNIFFLQEGQGISILIETHVNPCFLSKKNLKTRRNLGASTVWIHLSHFLTIETGALKLSRGTGCHGVQTGGLWMYEESWFHINYLEFLPIQLFVNLTVNHYMDNVSPLTYIHKKGGVKSRCFTALAKECWEWCMERVIVVSAKHIPGCLNIIADIWGIARIGQFTQAYLRGLSQHWSTSTGKVVSSPDVSHLYQKNVGCGSWRKQLCYQLTTFQGLKMYSKISRNFIALQKFIMMILIDF